MKEEIETITNAIDTLSKFDSYEYLKQGLADAGFIAQEVEEVLPYAVHQQENGFKTLNTNVILAYLHKAIIEINERLSKLENK